MPTRRVEVIPPQRAMHLAPSGDNAVCIVETLPGLPDSLVEVRGAAEALKLISALVTAFALPPLPKAFASVK